MILIVFVSCLFQGLGTLRRKCDILNQRNKAMDVTVIETQGDDNFTQVAWKAQQQAIGQNVIVRFDFNGIEVNVDASTNLDNLQRDFHNSYVLDRKVIGPNCADSLTKAETQELAEAQAKADEAERVRQEAYDAEQRQKTAALDSQISGETLALKDGMDAEYAAYVENYSKSGYLRGVVDYAEAWGKLMQARMAKGEQLIDIAQQTSHEADIGGITGFMHGRAVSALAHFWVHGDVLKKWYNGKYGQPDAEGVVNPAILTIG